LYLKTWGGAVSAEGVVGRDRELAAVAAFLDAVPSGPRGLLLEGEAGIGKTTVWGAGAAWTAGRSYTVLSCRPDGRHIIFTRYGFKGIISQVWVADISGRHAHPLTAPQLEADEPAWSPDGTHIAFTSNSSRAQSGIYVMRANGTGVTRLALTMWPTNNFGPAYAPGGGQIAFSSDRLHPNLCCEDLFLMGAHGSRQHLVATGIQGVLDVAWGTAPLVPAGSPGTLSHPPASAQVPGAARDARCREAPAWLTSSLCTTSSADVTPGQPSP
jgi:dipeptidyl aminopeptidase/acylaminoacyl peptidase